MSDPLSLSRFTTFETASASQVFEEVCEISDRESLMRRISTSLLQIGQSCPPLDSFTEDELREAMGWLRGYLIRRGAFRVR